MPTISTPRAVAVLGAALLLSLAPLGARAEDGLAREGFVGLGSAVCTLVYGPLKVAYAAGGIVIGSLAWLWTFDTDVAGPIFIRSVGGDYVVTPGHLVREKTLHFRGGR